MTHTIKKGDTLWALSQQYGTTVAELERLNPGIDARNLRVGQTIVINETAATATYTVQSGDTLSTIGSKLGVPWQDIARLNNITTPYTIHPGQVLRIPGGQAPSAAPVNPRTHTIKRGDTLWAIAKQYNTTVAELERLNPGIDARNLRVGQQIVISTGGESKSASVDIVKFYTDRGWRVTSPYGMRLHPIDKVQRMHHGIDFGGRPCGHQVYSPVNGVVVRAQAYNGYGNTVVIECARGFWHILAHAQSLRVRVGQKVEAGKTLLSLNGMTGTATGCHVHYQINPRGTVRGVDAVMDPRDY